MRGHRVLAILTSLALVGGASPALTAEAHAAPGAIGQVAPIDTTSLAATANAYNNVYLPTLSVPVGWTGSVDGCKPGAPSAAGLDAIATAYNYMRAMAGLAPVTVDPAMSTRAQAAALMLQATGRLSHWRDSSWACYDPAGLVSMWKGGEILATRGDAKAIPLYMLDPGAGNQAMGHRALLLSARVPQIGIGSTTNYNAIQQSPEDTTAAGPTSFGWPSPGYFPYELLATTATRWSFYTATGSFYDGGSWVPQSDGLSLWVNGPFTATVSVTKNGAPLAIGAPYSAINAATVWHGDAIGWDMPAFTPPPAGGVDLYRVTVSGLHASDGTTTTTSYDVKVYSAARAPMLRFTLGADMTGDGRGEVLGVDKDGVLWLFPGTASGALGDFTALATGLSDVRVYGPGDLNSDGKSDVLGITSDGNLWLYPGDGACLGTPVQVGSGWTDWTLVPAGDLNGDKKADLLGINAKGDLYMFAGKGNGTFAPRVRVGSGWIGWQLYSAGDLNGDGKTDILGINARGNLYQYLGKGTGTFLPRQQAGSGWNGNVLAAGADLNGDGKADIIGRNDASRTLWFYAGTGNAKFAKRVQIATGW